MLPAEAHPSVGLGLVEIAMIIFLIVFIVITARTLLTHRNHHRDAARIPLDDGRVVTAGPRPRGRT